MARRRQAKEDTQRLLEVTLQDVGVAFEPSCEVLDFVASYASDGAGKDATTPHATVSCSPTELKYTSCSQTASKLCPQLGPVDQQRLALELQDQITLRSCAGAYEGPLQGKQRGCLLADDVVPQAVVGLELEGFLENVDAPRDKFGRGLWAGLGAVLKQRGQMEGYASELTRYLEALGASSSSLKSVQFLESKATWWVDAADGLVQMLETKGVKRGQVIAIDAHTSMPEAEAAFSAHYSLSLPSSGNLGIRYKRTELDGEAFSWQSLYDWANAESRGRQIISMTGSRSRGGGGVFTSFYYVDPCDLDDIEVVERRSPDGRAAARELSESLVAADVRAGQILWVDAHQGDGVVLAAHYSRSLPSRGELKKLKCETCCREQFKDLHAWAASRLATLGIERENFVSATCTADETGTPACFLFYAVPKRRKHQTGSVRPFPVSPWAPPPALKNEPEPVQAPSDLWPRPLQVAAQMVDDFEVLHNTVIFLGIDVHSMPSTDLEACKDHCRQQRWGAFIVTNGQAYFRREAAEECENHLVTDPRSTTYLRRLPGQAGSSKLHLVGSPAFEGAVRHNACGGCFSQ